MATKDSFDAFVNIVRDKIDEFSESIDPPKIEIIQNELRERFNNLAESQGYVSSEEYEALKILAKRLEERVSKLEDLLSKPEGN
jgi:hypothetical protein